MLCLKAFPPSLCGLACQPMLTVGDKGKQPACNTQAEPWLQFDTLLVGAVIKQSVHGGNPRRCTKSAALY